GHPPEVRWPNNARLAVSIAINFEEGAENSIEAGDDTAERIGEVTTVIPPGVRDIGQEQLFAYGMRAGIWRILDALDRRKIAATFWMCGYAVQRVPQIARRVVDAGHEAACHGWRWRPHSDFTDPEAERQSLLQCIETIESATGTRPVGFYCRGSQSDHTRDLLIDLGFEYDSNALDDDLPYWVKGANGKSLLVIPYALDTNDMKFYHPNGFVTPQDFIDYTRSAIDALLEEGAHGSPKMLNIAYHLRIAGRPARITTLTSILDYLVSLKDAVWIARRRDIADFWREKFPT
ncbi:MAG: polysaccharide deacetylase family protein, partial [Betaproteobacteria bacterium]